MSQEFTYIHPGCACSASYRAGSDRLERALAAAKERRKAAPPGSLRVAEINEQELTLAIRDVLALHGTASEAGVAMLLTPNVMTDRTGKPYSARGHVLTIPVAPGDTLRCVLDAARAAFLSGVKA